MPATGLRARGAAEFAFRCAGHRPGMPAGPAAEMYDPIDEM